MDNDDAARALLSRLLTIDPENGSKIAGYILINYGDKDIIRFVYGPETLLVSIVNKAKTDLGLSSNTLSAPVVSPVSNSIAISRPNPLSLSLSSPRFTSNGFTPSSPSSPSIWSHHHPLTSPNAGHSVSYASVVNGACNSSNGFFSPSIGSPQIRFTGNSSGKRESFMDDYRLQDQNFSFLNDPLVSPSKDLNFSDQSMDSLMSPSCRSDSMVYPFWGNSNSAEENTYFGTDDSTSGFGYKPCLYFARGFCKNGSTCKFVHGGGFSDSGDNLAPVVGSPSKYDAFEFQDEMLRSKYAQQRRLVAQLMAGGVNLPYNKLNFLQSEAQRSAAAALMMSEEFHKLNRLRMARSEFSGLGMGGDSNPASRQIYLTFPADSTFKEEDVSNYFSLYGPVQDVRIPYQQKRMFGFVTFVYSQTVKLILAKGNPHFVCDSRVLVKPYKEKGKLPDKKQQHQQLERGEFSSCSSPCRLDRRESFEFEHGGRMFYGTQEMLLSKKLELQADFEQALEVQSRKLMNLQLLDLKNQQQHQHNPSVGSPDPSHSSSNQNAPPPSHGTNQDILQENTASLTGELNQLVAEEKDAGLSNSNGDILNKEDNSKHEDCELLERKV